MSSVVLATAGYDHSIRCVQQEEEALPQACRPAARPPPPASLLLPGCQPGRSERSAPSSEGAGFGSVAEERESALPILHRPGKPAQAGWLFS